MTRAFRDFSPAASRRSFGTAKLSGVLDGHADHRPALVLLHGLTFDHRMWLPAIAALRARDPERQVLLLDLPGHGDSPMLARCDTDNVAAAVASAVDDAGLDRPVLVGHSISAIIATVYACIYPTRGVVNVDQVLDTSFLHMLQASKAALSGPSFAHVWPAILASMHIELLSEDAQRMLSTELPRQDLVLAYWREALETPVADMQLKNAGAMAVLRRKEVPYTIFAGHQWDAATMQRLNEALPHARVIVVANSGHFPHLADPDRFAQVLAETGEWMGSADGC
jgi:pimeloyl-ACP methyl ester carboxylesterase